jgi:hypothetical protein
VKLINVLVSATGVFWIAEIAAGFSKERPILCVLSAFVYALNIAEAWLCLEYLAEVVVVPGFLLFVWLMTMVASSRRLHPIVSISAVVSGALLVHFRADLIALTVGLCLLAALLRAFHGRGTRRGTALAAAAMCVALVASTLPWSAFASHHLGRPVFMIRGVEASGFSRWLNTLSLTPSEWTRAYWNFDDGELDPTWFDERPLADSERAAAIRFLLEARSNGRASESAEQFFFALADRRTAESRFRYYLRLPLERGVRMWMHLEQVGGAGMTLFSRWKSGIVIYSTLVLPVVLLGLLGFALSWPWAFRWNQPVGALIAISILARTFSLTFLGAVVGIALFEVRYLAMVVPLANLLSLGFVVDRVAALRSRRPPRATSDRSTP